MPKTEKTLAQTYFETLREVHGDAYINKMLAPARPLPEERETPQPAPFVGHSFAHDIRD